LPTKVVVLAWTGRHVMYALTVGLGAVLIAVAAWVGRAL
jgi:hypothetical protein